MTQEIERKFLVERQALPAGWKEAESRKIVQGYLAVDADGTEVRLRRKGERCYLTVKSGGGVARQEGEIEIDRRQLDALWPFTEGRRVEKTRYLLPLEDEELTLELDIYEGALEGLITAEVELPSLEESERFAPPSWLGEEKTEDPRYKNRSLALHGLPEL